MTELRAGRKLSRQSGACTLYVVTPGDDRDADVCIGSVASAELAALIVGAVNGELPQVEAAKSAAAERLSDLGTELGRRIEAADRNGRRAGARAERARIVELLREGPPLPFLDRHGLNSGAGAGAILRAAAAEIEGLAP